MEAIADIIAGLLVIAGAIFALLAAVGIWRLPDIYSRTHAASKAGTLGSGLMLIALAVHAGDTATTSRAIAGVDRSQLQHLAADGAGRGRAGVRFAAVVDED